MRPSLSPAKQASLRSSCPRVASRYEPLQLAPATIRHSRRFRSSPVRSWESTSCACSKALATMQQRFAEEPPAINAVVRIARWLTAMRTPDRCAEALPLVVWSQALADMNWWRHQIGEAFRKASNEYRSLSTGRSREPLASAVDRGGPLAIDAIGELPRLSRERLESWLQARRAISIPTIDLRLRPWTKRRLDNYFNWSCFAK